MIACAFFKEASRATNVSLIADRFLLLIENVLAACLRLDAAITCRPNNVLQLCGADRVFDESVVATKINFCVKRTSFRIGKAITRGG